MIWRPQYWQWLHEAKLYILARTLRNIWTSTNMSRNVTACRRCAVKISYKQSMFNYNAVTLLKFGDLESKTAVKFTLLKARELIRIGYYSPVGYSTISASPCSCTKLFVKLLLAVQNNYKIYVSIYISLLS